MSTVNDLFHFFYLFVQYISIYADKACGKALNGKSKDAATPLCVTSPWQIFKP
jgi:hypothetical protein